MGSAAAEEVAWTGWRSQALRDLVTDATSTPDSIEPARLDLAAHVAYADLSVVDPARDLRSSDDAFDDNGEQAFADESAPEGPGGGAFRALPAWGGGFGGGSTAGAPAPSGVTHGAGDTSVYPGWSSGLGANDQLSHAAVFRSALAAGAAAPAVLASGSGPVVRPLAVPGSGSGGNRSGLGGLGGSGSGGTGSTPYDHAGGIGSQWIVRMSQAYETALNYGGLGAFFANYSRVFTFDNQARVLVNLRSLPGQLSLLQPSAVQLGLDVTGVTPSQELVTGYLPIQSISDLLNGRASLQGFSTMTPVWAPLHWAGSVTSQGDSIIQADTFRATTGLDGTGTTVGVLSDSVSQVGQGVAGSQATGDLPANVTVLQDGNPGNTDEGRAMLEVIHDVAPGAGLAFSTSDGGPQAMAQGILNLAHQAGATVIVDDTAYPDEPFFNHGVISQAVNQVANQQVTYVTAAGNLGNQAWADAFRPVHATIGGENGTFENFAHSGQDLLQNFTLPVGQTVDLELQWDAAFLEGGTNGANYQVPNQVRVLVTDANGTRILQDFSDDNINTDEALQRVVFTNDGSFASNNFALAVEVKSGPNPTVLKWVRFDGGPAAQYQGAPAVFGHAGIANAITVGAVSAASPNQLESFSSQGGPSTVYFGDNGARLTIPQLMNLKPEVLGPDGVATTFFGAPSASGTPAFYGTSAAAAHVAGAAALLEQKDPTATVGAVGLELETSTTPLGSFTPHSAPGALTPAAAGPGGAGLLRLAAASAVPGVTSDLFGLGQPVAVTHVAQNAVEEAITVDPVDPLLMFADVNPVDTLEAGNDGLLVSTSSNGGATWTSRLIATGSDTLPGSGGDPTCSWDNFGNLFVGYIGPGRNSVVILLSIDGGNSFEPIANLPAADQPTVVTGDGMVWVTFNNGSLVANGAPVFGFGSVGTFGANEVVPSSVNGNFGDIAIGPDGQVMVTFQHATSGVGPDTILVSVDPDGLGPAGFSSPVVVTRTNVGGFDPIPPQPNRTIDAEAGLAWDRSFGIHRGRVYLVYTDAPAVGSPSTNILVRFSDNNGSTWSAPVQVNDDFSGKSHFLPKIALDQTTGFVGVSWYDCRLDNGQGGVNDRDGVPNTDANIFAAISFDGGRSFEPNVQVTPAPSNAANLGADGGFDFGDYTGLAFQSGVLHPCWADNSVTLPGGHPPIFTVATAAISIPRGPDRFEPNETTDRATPLGTLNRGTQTYTQLNVFQHPNGLPDYDCYRWTAGARGTVTVTLHVAGEIELHVFTLVGNTLVQVGADLSRNLRSATRQVTFGVAKGQAIIVQVKGRNSQVGYHEQGVYSMTIQLR